MSSALTKYSVVTPKRPEATCLIAERSGFFVPSGSGLNRTASSPPSPVFDFAPIAFIATANVECASYEILPNDIAPVAKRFTMSVAVSTSSIGMGVFANLKSIKPRSVNKPSDCSSISRENSEKVSALFERTACCNREIVVGVQICFSPRTR